MKFRNALACLTGVAVVLGLAPGVSPAATVEEMLEEKALVNAYNPEVVDYLLEEGQEVLPDEQRQAALDQLVTALKNDIDITPEEQRAAALAAAGAGMAQLFGGASGSEYGGVAQDATYQVWRGWVDSTSPCHGTRDRSRSILVLRSAMTTSDPIMFSYRGDTTDPSCSSGRPYHSILIIKTFLHL